jgi:hypothetical protein
MPTGKRRRAGLWVVMPLVVLSFGWAADDLLAQSAGRYVARWGAEVERAAVSPPSGAGMVIYADPDAVVRPASPRPVASRRALIVREGTTEAGGTTVELDDRFMTSVTVRRSGSAETEQRCTSGGPK